MTLASALAMLCCGASLSSPSTAVVPSAASSAVRGHEWPARAQSARADSDPPFGFPLRGACGVSRVCPGDRFPAWSPDGTRIAFLRGFDLVVARPDGSAARALGRVHPWWGPIWSPAGRTLLVACDPPPNARYDSRLCTADADGGIGQRPKPITSGQYAERPLGWSSDGTKVAFTRESPYFRGTSWCCQLWVVDADGSNPILFGGGPPLLGGTPDEPTYGGAVWSPDGRLAFLAGNADRGFRLWVSDADGTDRRLIAERAFGPSWSPDGRLAYHVGDALWVAASDGSDKRLLSDEMPGSVIGWSPDSRRVFSYGQVGLTHVVRVLQVEDAQPRPGTILLERPPGPVDLALAPGGDMLSFVEASSGRVVVIEIDPDARGGTRRVLAEGVSGQAQELANPVWSPDGRSLLYLSDRGCPALLGLYSISADGRGDRQLTQRCKIEGSPRAETLVGTSRTDGIYGRGGADRIRAGDAPDLVHGGSGADTIAGGSGDDRLYGGPGRDSIAGGPGWDAIVSRDTSADELLCGPGRDVVWADRLDDVARDCERVERR